MVWHDMTQEELDAAYDQAAHAPNMDQVIARLAAASAAAREHLGDPLRMPYGGQRDECLDVYAAGPGSAVVIFVHGGSWRVGTAADNAFAAGTFVDAGVSFVVPDFSPVDSFAGNLDGMVDQLQRAVRWVYEHAMEFGGDSQRIYLAGFSSGAHLAAVLLTTDWPAIDVPADLFRGALLCSGMYDLTPVAKSFRREFLNLGPDDIAALSPQMHIDKIITPLTVACGTKESPEFQRQAREFTAALKAAGKPVQLVVGEDYNHFEIIETLGSPSGVLGRAVLEMI